MKSNEIFPIRELVIEDIENKRLKESFDAIRELIGAVKGIVLTERLNDLEATYKYMLHYMAEGQDDPQRKEIYDKLLRNTLELLDDVTYQLMIKECPSPFFQKKRVSDVFDSPFGEYAEMFLAATEKVILERELNLGIIDHSRMIKVSEEQERLSSFIFYHILSAELLSKEKKDQFSFFLADYRISIADSNLFVSAITLSLLHRFDPLKMEMLFELSKSEHKDIAIRAIVGLVPILQLYDKRWKLYPECASHLNLLFDDIVFSRRFMTAIIQFIRSRETEKITKKLSEEIIPEMMKLSPLIEKNIKLDDINDNDEDSEAKNPEWQNIIDDSGLADKLQEFSNLQMEGADVFHSTFSNLKSFPFFREISNWFRPFNKDNSSLSSLFSSEEDGDDMLKAMLESSMICDSDKYSFCFSMLQMPQQYRKMMLHQLNAESDQIKQLKEEKKSVRPNDEEDSISGSYIQDLYRFFKIYEGKSSFIDIFSMPVNYHKVKAFSPLVNEDDNLRRIALYYFEKGQYIESIEAYQSLSESKPDKEVWQKIGYAYQQIGDIEKALKSYLQSEIFEVDDNWTLRRIAHCYRILKSPEKALTYFLRLEQKRPDDMNIQLNIGHCYIEMKDYEKAINIYFKVEMLGTSPHKAWRPIAWCAFLSGKLALSEQYYAKIIENTPNSQDFLNAGHVALTLNKRKEALQFYLKTIKIEGAFSKFKKLFMADISLLTNGGVKENDLHLIFDYLRYGDIA